MEATIVALGAKLAPWIALLWSIDQLLKVIGQTFHIQIIDNVADGLGKLLGKFFPQK